MSAICQNFVQNAWRKDLCSNCFKSRDEHNQTKLKSQPLFMRKTIESIIKNGRKKKPKRNVGFSKELSEIIGYGGESWSSDDDSDEDATSTDDPDLPAENDEERELQKLTKANTDFNANALTETVDVKKTSYTQLMLGKPQVDAEGRKQTLLVSVTPFGQEPSPAKKYAKTISHIPVAKSNNNKEAVIENKNGVVLMSYTRNEPEKGEKSLLDEITETLENGSNPIQIISRKKIEKEVILSKPASFNSNNKENIQENVRREDVTGNDLKINTKSNIPERKNGLVRAPVIKKDQEKPFIYQTSVAKIELMNTKNLKMNGVKDALDDQIDHNVKTEVAKKEEKISTMEQNVIQQEPAHAIAIKIDLTDDTGENIDSSCEGSITSNLSEESGNDTETSTSDSKSGDKSAGTPPEHDIKVFPSREQAGEPDGRADPEVTEPPALPLTPPPNLDTHTSFLHGQIKVLDKPKVPSKPATIVIRKTLNVAQHVNNTNTESQLVVLSTFNPDIKSIIETPSSKVEKQNSNGSDIGKAIAGKRKAPQPPPVEEVVNGGVYSQEKHQFDHVANEHKMVNLVMDRRSSEYVPSVSLPEPAPRKSLSLSTDNLSNGNDEKKKKSRFSLKKFLRMGSSKDLPKMSSETARTEDLNVSPQPKPRLVIVHPLDLNGAKVEVVPKTDYADYANVPKRNEYMVPNITVPNSTPLKANKPPPPPRTYEDYNHYSKPSIPHPPKSKEILTKQKNYVVKTNGSKKAETVYANIGEVRSAIIPNKPQRTASMREAEAAQERKQQVRCNAYEPIDLRKEPSEITYDEISGVRSSSPECDSNKNSPVPKSPRIKQRMSQRSESTMDVSGDYFKYQNIPRSMSLTYCGSETESEIYSPYSFYGSESEQVAEDDHDWIVHSGKTHKLRSRKGRSIVHKNLEDNYGAVVVANHEALAQVLENIQQTIAVLPALRGLKTVSNLRWSDLSLKSNVASVPIGTRSFHQATWGSHHVTLVISIGPVPNSTLSLGTFTLVPITEFSDLIPIKYLPPKYAQDAKHLQATVAVLPWLNVNTIQSYGELLKCRSMQNGDDTSKDANFIMLQLVNALKVLQAQGVEELPQSLSCFVLCREMDKDTNNKLYVLQGLGEDVNRGNDDDDKLATLCTCATIALQHLQLPSKLSSLINSILSNERAVSLTQVKSLLEFSLWGPSDVALGVTVRERELALQRWLDLQRATVLHGLVCTKIHLTVYEEYHLMFLVRSTARMMCDASMHLESSNLRSSIVNETK